MPVQLLAANDKRSVRPHHEPVKERCELPDAIQRENMRDILIGPHDHHAAVFGIDATQGEDAISSDPPPSRGIGGTTKSYA